MRILTAIACLLLLTACGAASPGPGSPGSGSPRSGDAGPPPTAVPAADALVTSRYPVTVIDTNRPELCLGGVAESYPPQCSGPPIEGWDWSAVDGHYEDANGVRWGAFTVTGYWDGTTFTLDSVEPAGSSPPPAPQLPDFRTPCTEPSGGWVEDPDRVSRDDLQRAFDVAGSLDDYGYSWVDHSQGGAREPGAPEADDPATAIVNVAVTGDPAAAQEQLRSVWGGGLCVIEAEHTDEEYQQISGEVMTLPGALYAGQSMGIVELGVTFDDGSIQRWVDARFGTGLVQVHSVLVLA